MSQRFVRCAHCGLPHGVDETTCSITGRPVAAKRSAAPEARMMERPVDPPSRGREPIAARSVEPGQSVRRPIRGESGAPPPFEGAETAPPPPLVGQILGAKYRAIRVLGEGGMGAVYECEHLQLHRRVAVKVLHPQQAKKKASVQRFQNEAHVAGAIGHPNICEIYDMGELENNSPFLVMELLQGETLADRIASEGALPFDDIIDIISQVLSGLIAAHDKGIIHRDIKPENVFLTNRAGLAAMVKLLDFGISKVAGAEELHLTRTGMVMGTPFYMSPEQARGDRNLDNRVDLYATGVMMYECLTGRRPFHASNYNALLMQILTTDPRSPRDVRPAVSEGFERVVMRAMMRDRDRRYQSASEFQRDVQLLRDPGAMRRMPSVPPEPVPLITPRRRHDDGPASSHRNPVARNPVAKPAEMKAVSVNLEGASLMDSGPVVADSGSLEIPIVAEAPVSSREARALYRPDPAHEAAARSKSMPPPLPAKPAKAVAPALPQPRKEVAKPPKERHRAPTPTTPDVRMPDAPWLDQEHDADPTEIGSIYESSRPSRARSDTPIDADSTERIPPDRLARLESHLLRQGREEPEKAERLSTERLSTERLSTERFDVAHEKVSDDEAPTTLFDRAALKGKGLAKKSKSGPNAPLRSNTTERAPAPKPSGTPPPIPRLREPKDR